MLEIDLRDPHITLWQLQIGGESPWMHQKVVYGNLIQKHSVAINLGCANRFLCNCQDLNEIFDAFLNPRSGPGIGAVTAHTHLL